jgi:MoxR-like ATPase
MSQHSWRLIRNPTKPSGQAWSKIPSPLLAGVDDPKDYDADEELLDAANVAIELGQPLLLTGEPGCGKSTFADHVAWQLDLGRALRFQARSSTEARDLFYGYDDLGRFRAVQEKAKFHAADFVTLHALGEAIFRASDPVITREFRHRLLQGSDAGPRRSVVLIDEIDKAPRDVPNDLLGYLSGERIWFRIPEIDSKGFSQFEIVAMPDYQPIVIISSNSEKLLPDAFLRRCVFHEIAYPTGDRLKGIIKRRVSGLSEKDFLVSDADELMVRIRSRGPRKKPGLAELIGFLLALRARGYTGESRLAPNDKSWQDIARVTLLKAREDQEQAHRFLNAIEPG